jgi:hypothetical protein
VDRYLTPQLGGSRLRTGRSRRVARSNTVARLEATGGCGRAPAAAAGWAPALPQGARGDERAGLGATSEQGAMRPSPRRCDSSNGQGPISSNHRTTPIHRRPPSSPGSRRRTMRVWSADLSSAPRSVKYAADQRLCHTGAAPRGPSRQRHRALFRLAPACAPRLRSACRARAWPCSSHFGALRLYSLIAVLRLSCWPDRDLLDILAVRQTRWRSRSSGRAAPRPDPRLDRRLGSALHVLHGPEPRHPRDRLVPAWRPLNLTGFAFTFVIFWIWDCQRR